MANEIGAMGYGKGTMSDPLRVAIFKVIGVYVAAAESLERLRNEAGPGSAGDILAVELASVRCEIERCEGIAASIRERKDPIVLFERARDG